MKQYHDLLQNILDNGTKVEDRTGVGTISLFGAQMRFDLSKGFPAVTTKKLAFKSVKSELLWFLEGSTDERRLAEIHYGQDRDDLVGKKTIWTDNVNNQGRKVGSFPSDLNRVYGVQWRKWDVSNKWRDSIVEVEQNSMTGINENFYKEIELQEPSSNVDDLVGKILKNNNNEKFIVLENIGVENGNSQYKVQFLGDNVVNSIIKVSRPNLKRGQLKNPYSMTVANNRGCVGIPEYKNTGYYKPAYNMWRNIMVRCHGDNADLTVGYKDKGVFVDKSWRCFENFYRDIHNIPGFNEWKSAPSKYDLDKDYFGCNFYGRESCVFVPNEYNRNFLPNNDGSKAILAENKITGQKIKFISPFIFYKKFKIKDKDLIARALRQQNGNSKEWMFSTLPAKENHKWRQQLFVDQIANIIQTIKTNPDCRRTILSAWNVADIDRMALPPCHCFAQFRVIEGKLHCQMYQRSCDMFLGVPFNIASYALLTHMLAHVAGLEVGEFIHTLGDAHIYLNHIDQVKEQLSREEYPLPKLHLNPVVNDINQFTMNDIELIGYQSHPAIKAEMAV